MFVKKSGKLEIVTRVDNPKLCSHTLSTSSVCNSKQHTETTNIQGPELEKSANVPMSNFSHYKCS